MEHTAAGPEGPYFIEEVDGYVKLSYDWAEDDTRWQCTATTKKRTRCRNPIFDGHAEYWWEDQEVVTDFGHGRYLVQTYVYMGRGKWEHHKIGLCHVHRKGN
jgi:hypothetical protein